MSKLSQVFDGATFDKANSLGQLPIFPYSLAQTHNVGIYDLAAMSSLFQDRAGTVPVTAAGQTCLRVNDRSGNGYDLIAPDDTHGWTYQTNRLVSVGASELRLSGGGLGIISGCDAGYFFAAANPSQAANFRTIFSVTSEGTSGAYHRMWVNIPATATQTQLDTRQSSAQADTVLTVNAPSTAMRVIVAEARAAAGTASYSDGANTVSGAMAAATPFPPAASAYGTFGCRRTDAGPQSYMSGSLGSMILLGGPVLSAEQRAQCVTWLSARLSS